MQKVMTIEEFQMMMAGEESPLGAILRRIAHEADLRHLQKMEPQGGVDPLTMWVGWR